MRKIKLLIVQYGVRYLDVSANLAKFRRILKDNSYLRPDLVVFPEYALTGPLYSNYNMAFSENDPVFGLLSDIARENTVHLIPGSFIREGFNSSCLIDDKGRILGFYNKQNLWSSEKKFLKRGEDANVFDTKIGKIGLQICADLMRPNISAQLIVLKPELIVNIAMWAKEDSRASKKMVPERIEDLQTEVLSRARALENRAYFAFCNFGGKLVIKAKTGREYRETSIGNSLVADPFGQVVAKTSLNRQEVLFCEIDLAKCAGIGQ